MLLPVTRSAASKGRIQGCCFPDVVNKVYHQANQHQGGSGTFKSLDTSPLQELRGNCVGPEPLVHVSTKGTSPDEPFTRLTGT